MTGTIKTWIKERGFGFLSGPYGSVFAHISRFESDAQPMAGSLVQYDVELSERTGRPEAVNVVIIGHVGIAVLTKNVK